VALFKLTLDGLLLFEYSHARIYHQSSQLGRSQDQGPSQSNSKGIHPDLCQDAGNQSQRGFSLTLKNQRQPMQTGQVRALYHRPPSILGCQELFLAP